MHNKFTRLKSRKSNNLSFRWINERLKYSAGFVDPNFVFDVVEIPGKGMGVISLVDIPKGEVLFQEMPYVVVPSFQSKLNENLQCDVTFEELAQNTPLENANEVLVLSKMIKAKNEKQTLYQRKEKDPNVDMNNTINDYLKMKFSEGVNERALTMAKLMVEYYQKVENDYDRFEAFGDVDGFNHANRIVNSYMSVIFDDAIKSQSMPILPFQKDIQEWIKAYYNKERSSSNLLLKHSQFLEYQEFVKYYVKINLNHFEVAIYSPICHDLFGHPILNEKEEEEFKKQIGSEMKSSQLINQWFNFGVNHDKLFGKVLGLYPFSTFMNHHCHPNVEIGTNTTSTIGWLSSRNISQGEELTISYSGTSTFEERQQFLLAHHYFKCQCLSDEDCLNRINMK